MKSFQSKLRLRLKGKDVDVATIHDPEVAIPTVITRLVRMSCARILDIGYADRRCLRSCAVDAAFVAGIDPAADQLREECGDGEP
jgi:hypothetical protein